jgi:hypothetical protein
MDDITQTLNEQVETLNDIQETVKEQEKIIKSLLALNKDFYNLSSGRILKLENTYNTLCAGISMLFVLYLGLLLIILIPYMITTT